MRKITFQSLGEVQGSQVWLNREAGVEIIKGKRFAEVGLYYICIPTQDAAGRMAVGTATKLADARVKAAEFVEQVRIEISDAYSAATREDSRRVATVNPGSRVPAETDAKAPALDQPTPVNGDLVEWTGSADSIGYVTDVQGHRVSVAWTNRETGETGVDTPALRDFHRDWRITTTPQPMDTSGQLSMTMLTSKDVHPQSGHDHLPDVAPTPPAGNAYRVTFDRIGRRSDVDLGEFRETVAEDIARQVSRRIRAQHLLASRWFEVTVDLEEGTVFLDGGRFGRGKVFRA